jgi:hypothetical protein
MNESKKKKEDEEGGVSKNENVALRQMKYGMSYIRMND